MLTSSSWRAFSGDRPVIARADQRERHLTGVAAEQDRHRRLHPPPQLTALVEGVEQRVDAAVEQHHVRGAAGRVAAADATPMPTLAARIAAASLAPSPTIAQT